MTNSEVILTLKSLNSIGSAKAKTIAGLLNFNVSNADDILSILEDSHLANKTSKFKKSDVEIAISKANEIIEHSEKLGIKMISYLDENFPQNLNRQKKKPVVLLHYLGDISILKNRKACAVIGTRNPTEHGYKFGVRIAEKFASQEITVVSGLALGCDTAGHTGALNGKGKTVAVLAQGINLSKIYPKENRELANQIVESGSLLISEYSIDQRANQNFFVDRDRIQAGLSDFIFVVETGIKGGTMHTVNFALESQIPIAVCNHPDKFKDFEQTLGNKMLVKERKAVGIYSLEEIENFLSSIYADPLSRSNVSINIDDIKSKEISEASEKINITSSLTEIETLTPKQTTNKTVKKQKASIEKKSRKNPDTSQTELPF